MTGVQALERAAPTQPIKASQPERQEFEYIRHGTQTLIAGFDVATGNVWWRLTMLLTIDINEAISIEPWSPKLKFWTPRYPRYPRTFDSLPISLMTGQELPLSRTGKKNCGSCGYLGEMSY